MNPKEEPVELTLEDVAAMVGVSRTTVSNVINGTGRVSEATKARIRTVLQSTGFTLNASAQTLRRKTSRLLSILIPFYEGQETFVNGNPFYWEFFGGLKSATSRAGYQILLESVNPLDDLVSAIQARNLDGVVVVGAYESFPSVRRILQTKVPAVFVDSYLPSLLAHTVNSDDQFGAYLATRHLLGLGHRNILFVSGQRHENGVNHERWKGYCQALAEFGDGSEPLGVDIQTSLEAGRALAHRMAYDRPQVSAMFAAADIIAVGLIRGFHECGVAVPQRMSVVGFDDIRNAQYTVPTLTTIRQDVYGKGIQAGQVLLEIIQGKTAKEPGRIRLLPNLIVRESTGPAPP